VNVEDIQGEPEIDMYSHNYFNFTMLLLMGKRLLHISISGSPYRSEKVDDWINSIQEAPIILNGNLQVLKLIL